MIFRTKLAF